MTTRRPRESRESDSSAALSNSRQDQKLVSEMSRAARWSRGLLGGCSAWHRARRCWDEQVPLPATTSGLPEGAEMS